MSDRRDPAEHPSSPDGPHLSPEDVRVLDALMEAGMDPQSASLEPGDRPRADALASLFGLLDDYPVEDGQDSLIDATLARIDRHEQESTERMRLDPVAAGERGGRILRIRLHDLITVAALLLVVFSVGWPVLARVRQVSIDSHCADNLRHIGNGLAMYTNDHDNVLPMVTAGLLGGGGTWDTVRNSANLEALSAAEYCDHGHLQCPGHDGPGPCYSFALMPVAVGAPWQLKESMVLVTDRNPVIDKLMAQKSPDSYDIGSPNHSHRGQNLLRGGLAITWTASPIIRRGDLSDNIWLIRQPDGSETLKAGDTPTDPDDAFLAH